METKAFQHYTAPNDKNGNPRRVYVLFSIKGEVVYIEDVFDEGYAGKPKELYGLPELPKVAVTASEYKEWLKFKPAIA